jgi:hypothetical protein
MEKRLSAPRAASIDLKNRRFDAENHFLPTLIYAGKGITFILQIRKWTRFVWSLTPWSREVLNVMAYQE